MFNVIEKILKENIRMRITETLSIESWESSVVKSGTKSSDFQKFRETYIDNDNFKIAIENEIRKNYN